MANTIYRNILAGQRQQKKRIAVLVDPDHFSVKEMSELIQLALGAKIDFFFVGGSLLSTTLLDQCVRFLKQQSDIPVVLFPGSITQIHPKVDAILLLTLISGRNPDLLIGKHVEAAPLLKASERELIPTGYMLIDGGRQTTASYISNTTPIPADKPDIAAMTALAGEMLGLKTIYLDAGSGAQTPISPAMIHTVKQTVDLPLIVGGGMRTPESAVKAAKAGADIVVIGNVLEDQKELLLEIASSVHQVTHEPFNR